MTNMQGKTVLITGATNGIGQMAALELAKLGAQVVIVGRSREKTAATVSDIQTRSGNSAVAGLVADLSLMSEVRRLAEEYMSLYPRLDVLLNNAGAIFAKRQETAEGLELTFALNHMNYFLLTHLLLDYLKASAPSRIINVSSDAHRVGRINFDDLQNRDSYSLGGFRAYGQSKLMNILFTRELAKRLNGTGVTANAVHPGTVATGFGHNNRGLMRLMLSVIHRFSLTPERGADTLIYLASSPEVEGVTGKYFERRKGVQSSPESYDETVGRRLWQVSEQIAGIAEPTPV